jgi:hypothetical protein
MKTTSTGKYLYVTTTSRKHDKKKPESFVHCGSFDHFDMHSLNDYNFFVGLPAEVLGIWGLLIFHWKVLKNTFPTVFTCAHNFKTTVIKQKQITAL